MTDIVKPRHRRHVHSGVGGGEIINSRLHIKAMSMLTDDDSSKMRAFPTGMPDPQGQAALLLVESLIHGLLARSIISVGDAIEIVDTAVSVQGELAEAADGAGAPMWQARALLATILKSLKFDVDSHSAAPRPLL